MLAEPGNSSLLALMRLVSPALPVGAYSFSQGFEYSIECQIVHDKQSTGRWLSGVMHRSMQQLEVPLLKQCWQALEQNNGAQLEYWNQQSLAFRESRELRLEDLQTGQALWRLLTDLEMELPPAIKQPSWVTAFTVAAFNWQVALSDAAHGFVWTWLENQLTVAAKLVPLGQTDIQRLTGELMPDIAAIVATGLSTDENNIGLGMPGLVINSMLHETQYSRLFRS